MATNQTLNSAYCDGIEDVIRQLRETLSTAQLGYNTWSAIYAQGVDGQIDGFLEHLNELKLELYKVEKSRASGGDYAG